jgi:hypothetical protein
MRIQNFCGIHGKLSPQFVRGAGQNGRPLPPRRRGQQQPPNAAPSEMYRTEEVGFVIFGDAPRRLKSRSNFAGPDNPEAEPTRALSKLR